jgi:hypothetical protein
MKFKTEMFVEISEGLIQIEVLSVVTMQRFVTREK